MHGSARVSLGPMACVVGLLVWCAPLTSAIAQTGTRGSRQEIEEMLREVRRLKDVKCQSDANAQLICDSASQRTIWTFTLPAHPAHPAVVRRAMIIRGGTIGISRMGIWAGSEAAFNRWFELFSELDQRQVEDWTRATGRSEGR